MTHYENLMTIASLKNAKENYSYVISNHNLIKPTIGNRGGLKNKRVKNYLKEIANGTFNFDMSIIMIDKYGNINEGHHRFEALKMAGLPVKVLITKSQTLAQISHFNSGMKTNWTPEESFTSAETAGSKVIKPLTELRTKVCTEFRIDEKKISACELYGLLMKNTKFFSSGKNSPTIEKWMDLSLVNEVNKNSFKKLVRLYAKMKGELKNVRDAYKVCKSVMDLHFNDKEDFQLDVFCDVLVKGFSLDVYTVETIKTKALSMYAKGLKNRAA